MDLLKSIPEFSKHILITAFRNVKDAERLIGLINKVKTKDIEVQALNADYVATWRHLYFASLNALAAFENQREISHSLAMETLLYASAQHQIRKATKSIGINIKTRDVAMVIVGENPKALRGVLLKLKKRARLQEDETLIEMSPKKKRKIRRFFGVSRTELATATRNHSESEALVDLIIERMALLSIEA